MKTRILSRSGSTLTIAAAIAYAGLSHGGAFQISEVCGKCQGVRNAGAASAANSASTIYFNPAGMTRLDDNELDVSVHVILPQFEFSDRGSTNILGKPITGIRNDDGGKAAVVPNFFYSHKVNDQLAVGVGINTPYGLETEYDDNWVGRYQALKSSLKTVNVNPAIAYRVNDHVSVGAGVSAEYIDAELTQAVDFGTLVFVGSQGQVGAPTAPTLDGFGKIKGDDWAWGWNVGALFEIDENTRFGLSYRSKIKHTLDGDRTIRAPATVGRLPPPLANAVLARTGTVSATADFDAPASFMAGVYHKIDDRWAVMANAWWTEWSSFKELRVVPVIGADTVEEFNYRNSWRFGIGASYKYSDQWTFRAGYEYDETPSTGEITPRVPDATRNWFALGAGYKYSDDLSFDLAYTYIYIDDYSIESGHSGDTLRGDYNSNANIISAQLTWKF